MNLLDELIRFYYIHDSQQKNYMSSEGAISYHSTIISKGRVCYVERDSQLAGYCEHWRISYEQFGRILCGIPFFVESEDIENGPIAYLANTTILKEYRNGSVITELRDQFFSRNIDALYLVGQARRKKSEPVKVFKMQEAYKKWCKKEKVN